MSKIVRAINAMVSNADKITDITKTGYEYLFLYDKKHKWSLTPDEEDGEYTLTYYPGPEAISSIPHLRTTPGWDLKPVTYSTTDIGTREARESFRDLYTTVRDKESGLDKVIDEIIGEGGGVPF